MMPKVSVIMPVYNAQKFLKEAVDSVLNQTLKDIELIAIDDGSKDKSLDILKKYAEKDKRVIVLTQKNAGPGEARNKGIRLAKGEYIGFLDSDDFFELDMLEKMYKKAKHLTLDIVFCRFWLFNQDTQKNEPVSFDVHTHLLPYGEVFSAETNPEIILNVCITAVWSSLYRRAFILENDLKFSNATRVEDNLFAQCTMAMAKRISFLNERLIHYRRFFHTSLTDKVEAFWKNSFIVHDEVKLYLKAHDRYDLLKTSFLRHFLGHIHFHVIDRARYPIRNFAIQKTKNWLIQNDISLNEIAENISPSQATFFKNLFQKREISPCVEKIFYQDKSQILPVIYAVDEKDVPALALSIQSIIENASSNFLYEIYVFYQNLAPHLQNRLEALSQKNVTVSCVDIRGNPNENNQAYLTQEIQKSAYFSVFPYLIYGYEKVLYAKPNVVFLNDLSILYSKKEQLVRYTHNKFAKVFLIDTLKWDNKIKEEAFLNGGKSYPTDAYYTMNLRDLFKMDLPEQIRLYARKSPLYEYIIQQSKGSVV